MKKNIYKIAIAGLGQWGPNLARVVNESETGKLEWCCDLREDRLARIKDYYPHVKTTTNFTDILEDPEVHAIVIAVPATQHYALAKKAILAGKDVLVEKPLATDSRQAKELAELARRKKCILLVDHTFVFNPAIEKIRQLVTSNQLGKIYYGYGDYTALGPIRGDVSALWDLATHFLYTASHLLRKTPSAVSASGRAFLNPNIVDVVFLNLEFIDGAVFNLRVSWADPVKTRTLVLVGDKKMATFDDNRLDGKVTIYDRGIERDNTQSFLRHFFNLRYGDVTLPHIATSEPLKHLINSFFVSLKTRKLGEVSIEDAVNLVTILEAAQLSLKYKGERIKLKPLRGGFLSFSKR